MFKIFCVAIFSVWVATATAAERAAFVVGNDTYAHAPQLKNPASDARLVAKTLEDLGFSVTRHENLARGDIAIEFAAFLQRTKGAEVTLFYFAGHGLQFERKNYLLGTDAKLSSELDLASEAIELDRVIRMMERESRAALVFIDACRDNPLATSFYRKTMSPTRALATRGLAPINASYDGAMITFSASPGEVAYDGGGNNSPFAEALAKHLETGRAEILTLMKRVIRDVRSNTLGRQSPIVVNDLTVEIHLHPSGEGQQPADVAANKLREQATFDAAKALNTSAAYDFYLSAFPNGRFRRYAEAARDRLASAELAEQSASKPTETAVSATGETVVAALSDDAAPESLEEAPPPATRVPGLHAEDRRFIQGRLNELGYDAGSVDGAFGPRTRSALMSFQEDQKLAATGFAGQRTVDALNLPAPRFEEMARDRSATRVARNYDVGAFKEFPQLFKAMNVLKRYEYTYGWWNGSLYIAVKGNSSFEFAQTLAQAAGGHLVCIGSGAENAFVFELIRHDLGFWRVTSGGISTIGPAIGLRQRQDGIEPGGGWECLNGEPVRYTNWDRGEPNNHNGNESVATFKTPRSGAGNRPLPGPRWNDGGSGPGFIIEIE